MSSVFDRVAGLFEEGHFEQPPKLWHDPRIETIEEFVPAAVLIAITERKRPGMLLLHRPSTMRAHPGQIAFPGGRIDAGETPIEAALREANEELGIRRSDVRIVGQTDIYRTGSGYEITPVIGVVPPDLDIRPNPAEVAQWFEVPVDFVLDAANHTRRDRQFKNRTHSVLEIIWNDGRQDHVIWGITAMIIETLAGRLSWHG